MAEIDIDRLALEVPGMPESGARSLALAIANHLAAASLSGEAGEVPTMRVDLAVSSDAAPNRLAAEIVSEILRQLQRSP